MKFRPCIDLHEGQVKQIVGSTLVSNYQPATNFSTTKPAFEYAEMYQRDGLEGGHIIMLGPGNADAARAALQTTADNGGAMQVGGGITAENAQEWINHGASHVIVTSYAFSGGQIRFDRLNELISVIGRHRLVLDLSCRKKPTIDGTGDNRYYVVTDKWQTFTDVPVTAETLQQLSHYCDQFLVHGVDVEGKQCGILEDLVKLLGQYSPIPVTYAGGVRSLADLDLVNRLGNGRVDCTVGSALDIFGGPLPYTDVLRWHRQLNPSTPESS